ncbi:MAG TPA: N-6 DNA methylase, partial [Microthrixaceae bacterium]|nr:N-6 DNA methylase [Microthrixaceae bacterium]
RKLIEDDLVECIVAMPTQLFYTTGIPVCIWFLTKDKTDRKVKSELPQRDRKGEVLLIDARTMGRMSNRTLRVLGDDDVAKIADVYHAWRGEPGHDPYEPESGFSAVATSEEIAANDYVLTPGRYVGSLALAADDEPVEQKIKRLDARLREAFADRASLQAEVLRSLDTFHERHDG